MTNKPFDNRMTTLTNQLLRSVHVEAFVHIYETMEVAYYAAQQITKDEKPPLSEVVKIAQMMEEKFKALQTQEARDQKADEEE